VVLGYRFWKESFRECSACVSTFGTEGATPTGFIPPPEVAQRAANYRSLDARLDCVHRTPKLDAIELLHLHNLFG